MKINMLSNVKTIVKAKSPEILMIAGIATSLAAGVAACKATPKVSKILEDRKDNLEKINELVNNPEKAKSYDYDIEVDAKKDKKIINIQTIFGVVKEMALPIALETSSILCFMGSHKILK